MALQVLTVGLKRGTELLEATKAAQAVGAQLRGDDGRPRRGRAQRKDKELIEVVKMLRNQVGPNVEWLLLGELRSGHQHGLSCRGATHRMLACKTLLFGVHTW